MTSDVSNGQSLMKQRPSQPHLYIRGGDHPALLPTAAFSLAEVAFALGIFAFALVALLGLLPVAMKSSRDSLDISTATEVANTVAAELEQGSWSGPAYFDEEGNATIEANAIYHVRVVVDDSFSLHLKRAKITVYRGSESAFSRHFPYLIFQ